MSAGSLHFDRYELLGPLGQGGMGAVFKARAFGPHGFQKVVALKRVLPELAKDGDFQQRFAAEARVAALLHHTNVVQVFDFGSFGDELFLVMEYIHGLTLDGVLARLADAGRSITVPQALSIILEVARALDYAHRFTEAGLQISGVVHRDVSPSNILLSRSGEVKLTDFGVAQLLGPRRATADIAGKARYMAPEQARGLPVDGRADLYALGVVLYMLFVGKSGGEHSAHVTPSSASPRADLPTATMPSQLAALVQRLTQEDPDSRTASAELLIKEVLQVSYDHRFVLDPLELAKLMESLVPPVEDAAATPAADVLVAQRSETGMTRVERQAPTRGRTLAPRGKKKRWPLAVAGAVLAAAAAMVAFMRPEKASPLPEGGEGQGEGPIAEVMGAQKPESAPQPQPQPQPPTRPEPKPRAKVKPVVQSAPPAPQTFGSVDIFSSPWAEVWLDGQHLPETAPVRGLKVPSGKHKLKLVHPPTGASTERDIEVLTDKTLLVQVQL